ncbi:MAG: formylglycine-generating enzyme family protein [Bdellovibrionales bacterium]
MEEPGLKIKTIVLTKKGEALELSGCESTANDEACVDSQVPTARKLESSDLFQSLKLALGTFYHGKAALQKKGVIEHVGDQKNESLEQLRRKAIENVAARLRSWIRAYGLQEKWIEKLEKTVGAIWSGPEVKTEALPALEKLIDQILREGLSQKKLKRVVHFNRSDDFEFGIFLSALQAPKLDAEFVRIPKGTFKMGSETSESGRWNDEQAHQVQLTSDFELQTTEITQWQWFSVMGYNPSRTSLKKHCEKRHLVVAGWGLCPENPVEGVSWNEVQIFISKLNRADSAFHYRLPTEAEWERAARGDTTSAYFFGDKAELLRHYAWYFENSDRQTQPVASKKPNMYGVYDLNGNVFEWVQDFYGDYPKKLVVDPTGPSKGDWRVFRGGAWNRSARPLRSAFRRADVPEFQISSLGFRLVRFPAQVE